MMEQEMKGAATCKMGSFLTLGILDYKISWH